MDIVKEGNNYFAQLLEQKTQKKRDMGSERHETNLVARMTSSQDGKEHWVFAVKEEGT